MKKVVFTFFIFSLILSCSKEKESIEPFNSIPIDFTPMSVGNYWVYQHYHIDTLGNESQLPKLDSVYIADERNIRGHMYYIFKGSYYYTSGTVRTLWVFRDSSGYLVDTNGRIHFAKNDFRDSLVVSCYPNSGTDTSYCSIYQMKIPTNRINVPAGTFNSLNFQETFTFHNWNPQSPIPNPRKRSRHYANGIGRILETYFLSSQIDYNEIRLLRYKVQ